MIASIISLKEAGLMISKAEISQANIKKYRLSNELTSPSINPVTRMPLFGRSILYMPINSLSAIKINPLMNSSFAEMTVGASKLSKRKLKPGKKPDFSTNLYSDTILFSKKACSINKASIVTLKKKGLPVLKFDMECSNQNRKDVWPDTSLTINSLCPIKRGMTATAIMRRMEKGLLFLSRLVKMKN